MRRISTLWKANIIAFISSFCVMVIELVAARILAPHIGVSLYTWTSIIGVILAGIALGNFLGGRLADKRPSPLLLAAIFIAGGLSTIAISPITHVVAYATWIWALPVMARFTLIAFFIFFLPAIILSMVSPMVIKLTLADLGQTGGVVGTIYAFSTAGSILGTFMTGFYFIIWFGTGVIVWLVAAVLILTGIIAWFLWGGPGKWSVSLKNIIIWIFVIELILTSGYFFLIRDSWQETYTKESNYYAIRVIPQGGDIKVLALDDLIHSYNNTKDPTVLIYDYINMFREIMEYTTQEVQSLRVLHLGGGGYTFPMYLEAVYPGIVNEVVEIDPAVTQIAYDELGLPLDTSIKTYNQDARLFLIQQENGDKYDIVVGDAFNSRSVPYHLTTMEFHRLVKSHMKEDGIYMANIIDDYYHGKFVASSIFTLKKTFNNVYLFDTGGSLHASGVRTLVIAATDRTIDLNDYRRFVTNDGTSQSVGNPRDEIEVEAYLSEKEPVLLTDDYAPTDILLGALF